MRPTIRLSVASLVACIALAACAQGEGGDEGLLVYSGRTEDLAAPLYEMFTAATGIEVTVRYAGSPELAATLLAEGASSEADLFFTEDPASLGTVRELAAPLPQATLDQVEPRFRDDEGHWVGTSARSRVFVYNRGTSNSLPGTIDDVIDPQWSGGKLGIAPTNASFLSFVAAMILERGEAATSQWLQGLAALDPVIFPSNAPIVEATDNGELEGGLVNHYYLLRLRAEGAGEDAENHFIPAGDVGSLILTGGVEILAAAPHPEAAQRFVDFLFTEEAQNFFATNAFEYPLMEGIPPPVGTPPLSELRSPDIDLSDLAGVLDDATRLVAEAGLV